MRALPARNGWVDLLAASAHLDELRAPTPPDVPATVSRPINAIGGGLVRIGKQLLDVDVAISEVRSLAREVGIPDRTLPLDDAVLDDAALRDNVRGALEQLLTHARRAPSADPGPQVFDAALKALVDGFTADTLERVDQWTAFGLAFLDELEKLQGLEGSPARLMKLWNAMPEPLRRFTDWRFRLDDGRITKPQRETQTLIDQLHAGYAERAGPLSAKLTELLLEVPMESLDRAIEHYQAIAKTRLFFMIDEVKHDALRKSLASGDLERFLKLQGAIGIDLQYAWIHSLDRGFADWVKSLETGPLTSSVQAAWDTLVMFRGARYLEPKLTRTEPEFYQQAGSMVAAALRAGKREELEALAEQQRVTLRDFPFAETPGAYEQFMDEVRRTDFFVEKGLLRKQDRDSALFAVIDRGLPKSWSNYYYNMWHEAMEEVMRLHPELDFEKLPNASRHLYRGSDVLVAIAREKDPNVISFGRALAAQVEAAHRPLTGWRIISDEAWRLSSLLSDHDRGAFEVRERVSEILKARLPSIIRVVK